MRFLFLFLIFSTSLSGQDFWIKGQVSGAIDESNLMIQCSDGGFLAVGHRYQAFIDPYVSKFNSNGDIEWEKTYKISEDNVLKFDVYVDVIELSDGYLLAASSFNGTNTAHLQKIDFNGELLNEWVFEAKEINCLEKTSNHHIYALMTNTFNDCQVYGFDEQVELQWKKDLPGAKFSPLYGHAIVNQNNHFTLSTKGLFNEDIKLYEINEEGELLIAHSIEQQSNPSRTSLHVSINDDEWVCIPEGKTQNHLQKIDKNTGAIIQTKDLSNIIASINEMINIFDGIYMVGHALGDAWPSIWVFDVDFNLVDTYYLKDFIIDATGAEDGASIVDMKVTKEGHIAFAGSVLSENFASGFLNGHISRFGDFDAVSNEDLIIKNGVKFYPNPVTNWAQITSNNAIESIKIFATSGTLIRECFDLENEARLNLESLPQGSYLLKCSIGGEYISLPFVKL